MMKRAFSFSSLILLAALLVAGCGSTDLSRPTTQRDFGVRMARMNLWREALFRFKRAVEMSPQDAMAHNNLAVAYEAVGDFENAQKEYREAMRLDKSNQYIQKNYSRLVEFTSRNKKRQAKEAAAAAKTAATTTTAPATNTSAAPAEPATKPPSIIPATTTPQPAPTPTPTPKSTTGGQR